ncbi:MFS transporter [Sedimenticola selenatireducens]|uniref:MFS transporter n=1 Tax=Sedimenticola selenatireducens TaxID=191960 RepID=A0A557SGU0_9GAMM|nr:MFS transporter [Sedimenticola selenatireducens]TVO76625.1 MFS transporter [Sedimenticola selenatireducens]TVT64068.1 MAG: MFS transporter [Sedimenticola selenatireducens]
MSEHSPLRLQLVVFALVAASFTNIYLTQPVLPVLQAEFVADTLLVSYTVAAVILGIALSNLPFGVLVDRLPIQPIILIGGIAVAIAGLICATTHNIWLLIGARFVQGLFIPALTTCLAAYLAKSLPIERLNVVMGSYVSATVVGGLGGRLLGGWIHPPLHWRYAFVSAAVLILIATFAALRILPSQPKATTTSLEQPRFLSLLKRWELVRIYLAAAGGFFIFSSVFNYLPFRLAAAPFSFSTELITLLYLVYVMGIFMGPLSGRISNRIGSGYTLMGGTLLLGVSITLTLLPYISAIILGLLGLCAGFFAVHAAAVGSLNRRLTGGQGRANALYVLFYYVGGWIGITASGFAYTQWGWQGVILICLLLLLLPFMAGIGEQRDASR